jgi:hypothetical protein
MTSGSKFFKHINYFTLRTLEVYFFVAEIFPHLTGLTSRSGPIIANFMFQDVERDPRFRAVWRASRRRGVSAANQSD